MPHQKVNMVKEHFVSTALLGTWFQSFVDRFRDNAGDLRPALELKYFHSLRVAGNARVIARHLGWSEGQCRLAEQAGMVHDVGRFSQYVEFRSFQDADTVDHGACGRSILETENALKHLSAEDRNCLLCAVAYHNRLSSDIPQELGLKERHLLDVIRDADKLDIMELVLKAVAADGFQDLPTMLPRIRLSREITPVVLTQIFERNTVSSGDLNTLGDYLVMLAIWFFDLNYSQTLHLAVERNLINRIRKELPDQEVVENLFDRIRASMPGGRP